MNRIHRTVKTNAGMYILSAGKPVKLIILPVQLLIIIVSITVMMVMKTVPVNAGK